MSELIAFLTAFLASPVFTTYILPALISALTSGGVIHLSGGKVPVLSGLLAWAQSIFKASPANLTDIGKHLAEQAAEAVLAKTGLPLTKQQIDALADDIYGLVVKAIQSNQPAPAAPK